MKLTQKLNNLFITIGFLFASINFINAANITAGTSNYNITATAAGGTSFTTADNLTLNGWGNPTYNLTSNVQVVNLTLSQSVKLNQNGYRLTVTGNLSIEDNNSMYIDLGTGGQLLVTGTANIGSGSSIKSTSAATIQIGGNLTMAVSNTTSIQLTSGGQLTVGGNVTMGSSSSITGTGACLMQVAGTFGMGDWNNTTVNLGSSGTFRASGSSFTVGYNNVFTTGTLEMIGCGGNMIVNTAFTVTTFKQSSSCGTTITRTSGTAMITCSTYDQNGNSTNIKPTSNFTITGSTINRGAKTWDGGGADNNMMTAANWVGDIAPSAGDAIVFSGSTRTTPNNNYTAGTVFSSISFSSTASSFTISGNNITLSGGATAITASNTTGTMTISANITFSTAAPTITSTSGGTLVLSGTVANGGYLLTNASAGTTTISGVISGTGGITKSGSGTLTLSGANTYSGGITISGGIFKLNNVNSLGSTAAGTTISSGATLDLNGIAYSSAEALTISGTGVASGGALINSNATGASFAGAITMAGATTITTTNAITLTGNITGGQNLTKAGSSSLTLSGITASLNTLTISAGSISAGNSTINIIGNFSNSGTYNSGTSTVNLNGPSTQYIDAATFYNLTFNKSTGTSSLNGNITTTGTITMTSGILNTGNFAVNLGSTGTLNESNPSSAAPTSYITGYVTTTRPLIQNTTNTFGGIGLELTETTLASNSTVVTRRTGTSSTGAGHSSILRYYDITPAIDINLNGTLKFYYFDSELNGQSEANLKMYKSEDNGTTWSKQSTSSVSASSNYVSLNGITSFSRWTATNFLTDPLPVTFSEVKGVNQSVQNLITWSTVQESNNDYFDIERSNDGINFDKIGQIKGNGTSASINHYNFIDKSYNSLHSYYRLKQVDYDGKFDYSIMVYIKSSEMNNTDFHIYPNPLESGHTLYANLNHEGDGIVQIEVFDYSGKHITTSTKHLLEGKHTISFDHITTGFKKGIYFISIKTNNNDYKQKLEVR